MESLKLNTEIANLEPFLNSLAAKQPTPGGGSASALGGAIGAALGSMAANFTVGNVKYPDFDAPARAALAALESLRSDFLRLMEEDIAAYGSYRAAVAMPKISPEEKSARILALAAAREQATVVPERIVHAAQRALDALLALSSACNPNLAGDVASAAFFLEACARGAEIQIIANCATNDPGGANIERRRKAVDAVARCLNVREKIVLAIMQMMMPAA